MRYLTFSTLLASVMLLFTQCKKEGDPGLDGAPGADGADGADGNANVIAINYGARTFSGTVSYELPSYVTQGMLDSSVVLAYYNPSIESSNYWYTVPGLGSGATYQTRSYWYASGGSAFYVVRLVSSNGDANYTASITFQKFRIIIIPASRMETIAVKPDLSDYKEVSRYFDIKE